LAHRRIHRVGYFRRNKCRRIVIEIEQWNRKDESARTKTRRYKDFLYNSNNVWHLPKLRRSSR
jgi:hypothetical protein